MEEFKKDETKFQDTDLLEPIEFYKHQLKDAFHENAEDYFEYLSKKAETNVEANREAVKKYDAEVAKINSLSNNAKKQKSGIGWMIFLLIMSAFGIAIPLVLLNKIPLAVSIAVPIGCAGLIALAIVMIVKMKKKWKKLNEEIAKHQEIANKHKAEAEGYMAKLNSMFEANMAALLMSKTTPVIDLDRDFDPEKYTLLHEKYGYTSNQSPSVSTLFAQSGHILGNPFVIAKTYVQSMRDHVYRGTLTITWTERVSDGKGGTRTVLRSETLVATVTAPEPAYHIDTTLIYGNEAAPNLSFSRSPTGHGNDDDKHLEKYIKSFDKKLDKEVEKDLKRNDDSVFTRLHNSEFEALFNALNRDNEMEFRLLFTPLAQKNMISLIRDKDKVGYGDDFSFRKSKKLNYIGAGHLYNSSELDKGPSDLRSYSYDIAHRNFVDYCDRYCKQIYFALAPLISIPLYQQHKTLDFIYNGRFGHNVTQEEAEAAANCHNWNLFKHPATRSVGVILKSKFVRSNESVDECEITAHSFSGTDRVSYIRKYGGDGRWHDVPVKWIEYNPISQVTPFAVGRANENTYYDFNGKFCAGDYNKLLERYQKADQVLYKKGLFSFVKKG